MGTPSRYSLEIPGRCLHLINELWPTVEKTFLPGQEEVGPLTTTFLLGMAAPVITLPVERIERHRGREEIAFLNERPLDGPVADEIDRVLLKGSLGEAPFFEAGQWRFASVPYAGQNLAISFPKELTDAILAEEALAAAHDMPATQWTSCLRNALAHGGVLYLDRHGGHQHGQKAEILAFVSARYPKYPVEEHPKGSPLFGMRDVSKRPEQVMLLQVSEVGFVAFLRRWVEWLTQSGLTPRG